MMSFENSVYPNHTKPGFGRSLEEKTKPKHRREEPIAASAPLSGVGTMSQQLHQHRHLLSCLQSRTESVDEKDELGWICFNEISSFRLKLGGIKLSHHATNIQVYTGVQKKQSLVRVAPRLRLVE